MYLSCHYCNNSTSFEWLIIQTQFTLTFKTEENGKTNKTKNLNRKKKYLLPRTKIPLKLIFSLFFHSLVMHKVWELAKTCPQPALDWLSIQVARNRYVQSWLVSTMNNWVEQYLLAHPNHKVRSSAAFLVVSLVNSSAFRQAFR